MKYKLNKGECDPIPLQLLDVCFSLLPYFPFFKKSTFIFKYGDLIYVKHFYSN